MSVTFASVSRLIGLMSERDSPETVAPSIRTHLITATHLITSYIGMPLVGSGEDTVLVFDTSRGPTHFGLALPAFNRQPLPVFDLPLTGLLPGLQIRYRESGWTEEDFDWNDLDPLRPGVDYEHDEAGGRIRLLFQPGDRVSGLQVRYGTDSTSRPDIMIGSDLKDALSRMLITPEGVMQGNPAAAFGGVPHKRGAQSLAMSTGSGFTLQHPDGAGIASLTLYGPRDVPMAAQDFSLIYTGAGRPDEPSGDLPPLIGARVEKSYPEISPASVIGFRVAGAEVSVSKIAVGFFKEDWRHMEGLVPEVVSQACAQLARFLYGKSQMDGVGKTSDKTRRSYAGSGVIPQDIRDMLTGLRRGSSSVTMI